MLSSISLINRCGGLVIAFLTLYLTQQLHFSIRDAGYATMFFGIGAFAGGYVGGRLTDRIGSFPVQFASLLLNGLVLLLLMQVHEFNWMCGGIFFMALVSEMFRPANSVAIANFCTPETRTRSISLYRMSINLGWAVAPAFGGLMVAISWTMLFWVDGLTCIFAAFMLYFLLPPARFSIKPSAKAKEALTENQKDIPPYRDRQFLWFVLLTMLNATVFMQFLWTVPVFWKEGFGWTEAHVGLMSAINGLIVFMVELPLIFRIEGQRKPVQHIQFGLMLYATAYALFLLPISYTLMALLFVVVISFGEIFVMPFSSNYVFGRSKGAFQGQYMAFYGIAYSIANTLAPLYGTQVIAAWGYQTLWILLSIQAVLVWIGFRFSKW